MVCSTLYPKDMSGSLIHPARFGFRNGRDASKFLYIILSENGRIIFGMIVQEGRSE
jgi:hypothetical protein